jgi:prophage DNA circulation protein
MAITEKQSVASWSVPGFNVRFPIAHITETGGNRLVERERPYRNGAKLDDTGSRARRWRITVLFENTIEETDLSNGGLLLYPDVLRLMLQSFSVHETGELVIPAEGKVKARAADWERTEAPEERDAARVVFTFIEDNQDAVGVAAFAAPSATANARKLAESTTFDQESLGNGHLTIAQMQEAVSSLEGLANAPDDYRQELEWTAKRIGDLAKQTVGIFSKAGQRGRDTLLGPRGSRAESKMARSQDMAARATAQPLQSRPAVGRYITKIDISIFDLAAFVDQPADMLIAINPQIEDLFFIPAGSEVRVFTSTGTIS